MACILINDEVQSTFSIKDLEKAISDILSTEEQQIIISPEGGIGYISRKEYAEKKFFKTYRTYSMSRIYNKRYY